MSLIQDNSVANNLWNSLHGTEEMTKTQSRKRHLTHTQTHTGYGWWFLTRSKWPVRDLLPSPKNFVVPFSRLSNNNFPRLFFIFSFRLVSFYESLRKPERNVEWFFIFCLSLSLSFPSQSRSLEAVQEVTRRFSSSNVVVVVGVDSV